MARWKIGSFTAALGCIILGVIIVLAQFDVINYGALGYLWPALLILFGLETLLRIFIKSDAKTRVSGWAIVLIVVLVAASGAQTVLAGGSLSGIFGNRQLVPVEGTAEVQAGIKKVKIELPNGKVKVEGADEGILKYEGNLEQPGSSAAEASSALERNWTVTAEGDTLTMKLDGPSGWLANIHIGININNPYLNVTLPRNLEVEVETSDGSIEASNLESGIEVDTSNGRLDIHDVAGGVDAHTSNGTLTVQNVQGEVKLVTSNGALNLGNIDGSLSAKSSNGKITINSAVTGDWECASSNGKIEVGLPAVTDATITADTSNGSLKGNVSWDGGDDNHGTAVLGSGTHKVSLSTSNGSVTVDTAQ
ncbi:DUF4097 family beta strand repeat-containing protein [Paenibacillus sp. S150]|uniref:LiaF transmembrane domain-containing protein n=1 Tax=Paenibacillus sp. S150 TaxID=2749826 RepID=UPI001C5924A1|nr:DUF4097 family beta strand repeat-containing protein [Paenibacillus sp. S150]MBW4084029.1 DUF4097 family beta strand repeat protein [Paenibacillus sp. S150]